MSVRSRRVQSPNVAIASGSIYPNGVDVGPANADVQATVRPGGWLFHPSAGYETIRVGRTSIDLAHPNGTGIHFTPMRFAENVARQHDIGGPPALIDPAHAMDITDVADIPGSEYLDGEGKLPAYAAAQNAGPYLSDAPFSPMPGTTPAHGGNTLRDMGDRNPTRPLTRAFYGLTTNPAAMLRAEWQQSPGIAVVWALGVLGIVYMLTENVERQFRGRRGRGVAATAGAAPAAAAAGTGKTVADTADAANKTLTAAGAAVEKAVSSAGDAVSAAGEAVDKAGEAAADAVKS